MSRYDDSEIKSCKLILCCFFNFNLYCVCFMNIAMRYIPVMHVPSVTFIFFFRLIITLNVSGLYCLISV